jgi:hypothetical protein
MSAEFVPFLQSMNARAAAPAQSGDFSPLPQNSAAVPPSPRHGDVKVELKREGDRVSQIRIQCRCGELIELACEY